jgi:hypothetical protein
MQGCVSRKRRFLRGLGWLYASVDHTYMKEVIEKPRQGRDEFDLDPAFKL